jgi:PAS domain S-box-containing protein
MTNKPTYEELEQRVKELEQDTVKDKQAKVHKTIQDHTEIKILAEKMQKSEAKFHRIVENTPAIVYQFKMSPEKIFSFPYVSRFIKDIMGVSAIEVMKNSSKLINMIHPEDKGMFVEKVLNSAETMNSYHEKFRCLKNGDIIWVECRTTPYAQEDGSILWDGLFVDVTERMQAEDQIKANLKEKETLLQEIHHRVKNNMIVISSLLKLQSNSIKDERLKTALMDSQNRVQSMSAIHEVLYQSDNLSSIDMNTYLSKLTEAVAQNYTIGSKVSLLVETENILIGAKQASPIGLIVNELITNSFKYAFPENQEGEIKISLQKMEDQIELEYADNGIGIPEGFDLQKADSLGLKLVKLLTENQLDGSIDMENKNGTKFTIKFNIEA